MALTDTKVPQDILLQAAVVDNLSTLVWFKTKDGQKGRKRPKSLVAALIGARRDDVVFDSADDFMKAREKLMKGGE